MTANEILVDVINDLADPIDNLFEVIRSQLGDGVDQNEDQAVDVAENIRMFEVTPAVEKLISSGVYDHLLEGVDMKALVESLEHEWTGQKLAREFAERAQAIASDKVAS